MSQQLSALMPPASEEADRKELDSVEGRCFRIVPGHVLAARWPLDGRAGDDSVWQK